MPPTPKATTMLYIALIFFFSLINISAEKSVSLDYFKRAIERNPNDLNTHLNYQQVAIETGHINALIAEYRTYMQAHPQNANYLYLYGHLLDNDDQKRMYLSRAIQADSSLFQAQFDLGKLHYYAGEYNDAIARYRIATRLKPDSPQVANLLGLAHYHSGHPENAIAAYQKAIQNDPTYKDAYLNLGLSYYYTSQFEKAIQTYKTALQKAHWDNDQHLLYHNLGMAYRKNGDIKQATTAYQNALKHNPNYSAAHISLGNLALHQANYTQAISSFQEALKTDAENADLHLRLGLAYFNTQNYPQAITFFQNTLDRDSTNVQTHHYLGRAYYLNEQPEKAIESLESFIQKEKRQEKRPQVAQAKKLIFDIKKERFTKLLD